MSILTKAYDFAAKAHQHQVRKNKAKTPYINHAIEVAHLAAEALTYNNRREPNEWILVAAVLHDTVEVCDVTLETIQKEFGPEVALMVEEVTDDKKLDEVTRKKLQIEHAKIVSEGASYIKLADKYSNLQSLMTDPPVQWSPAQIQGYIYWSYAVIREILIACPGNTYFEEKFKLFFERLAWFKAERLEEELQQYYKLL